MKDEARHLKAVSESVSDGCGNDWPREIGRVRDPRKGRMMKNLQILDAIAAFYRAGLQPGEAVTQAVAGSSPAPEMPPLIQAASDAGDKSRTWGPLQIEECLGRGAFGEVYRAHDPGLQRDVALKLIRLDTGQGDALEASILDEGRLMAKVRHTNVVTVHGIARHDGILGLWMELIEGETLTQRLSRGGRYGASEAATVGIDLCRALAAVHAQGLVHRDIKAGNVMRERGGRLVLMDFGLGRRLGDGFDAGTGEISGTPLYMAPEILKGSPATRQSDIYSLGVLLFHLLTTDYPVKASGLIELNDRHTQQSRSHLTDLRPDLPPSLIHVIETALATDPGQRYASAGVMETALEAALGLISSPSVPSREPAKDDPDRRVDDPPQPARHLWSSLAAAAALVLAFVAGYGLIPTGPDMRAQFFRVAGEQEVPLSELGEVQVGDELFLEIEVAKPSYVYVLNRDQSGRGYLLFPLPGAELRNPLPSDEKLRLPGRVHGSLTRWQVDSRSAGESLILVVADQRLSRLEDALETVSRAQRSAPPMLEPPMMAALRGIGSLAWAHEPSARKASAEAVTAALDLLKVATDSGVEITVSELTLAQPGSSTRRSLDDKPLLNRE